MEGDNSDIHKFKKPGFPHSQPSDVSESSSDVKGKKRAAEDISSTVSSTERPAYIRDTGVPIYSKDPKD
jgi:hypothetical protein